MVRGAGVVRKARASPVELGRQARTNGRSDRLRFQLSTSPRVRLQTTYALVVVSAALHAYWNYLIKRSGGTSVFVGLSKIAEVVVYAPVFIVVVVMRRDSIPGDMAEVALLVSVGAALTLTNYVMLSRGYARGALSLVYPLSRGAGLLFLPVLGFLVFHERLSVRGSVALAIILVSLVVIARSSPRDVERENSRGAIWYAVLAGMAAAGYTVWDKRAIGIMPTFVYFYTYSVLVAVAYLVILRSRYVRETVRAEWRAHRWPIVQVAVLNTAAYLLVLVALNGGTSTYVIALRQLSIVFGAGLGAWLLGERQPPRKAFGLAMLAVGCGLIAFA